MNCNDASAVLYDYLLESLEPDGRQELERHFEDCAACRSALGRSRKALRVLDEWQPHRPASGRRLWIAAGAAALLLVALAIAFVRTPSIRIVEGTLTAEQGRLWTGSGQRGAVLLPDESRIDLGPETELRVDQRRVDLDRGSATFRVARKTEPFTVKTAVAEIGVLGTRFEATLDAAVLVVRIFEGTVRIHNAKGELIATASEEVRVNQDEAPAKVAPDEPLPAGALARMGGLRFRHGGVIRAIACSPDGKRVASAGGDVVRIWEVATGKEEVSFRRPEKFIEAIAFSPDGKRVVTGGPREDQVCVWDAATGNQIDAYNRLNENLRHVGFLKDGVPISWGGNWTCSWDPAKGFDITDWGGSTVAPAPDGKTVALAEGTTLRLRDKASSKDRWKVELKGESLQMLAFSPDGALIAAASSGSIAIVEAADGTQRAFWEGLSTSEAIAFSNDGAFVAASAGRVWDLATGRETARLRVGGVGGVAFLPGSTRAVFGSMDGVLQIVEARTGKKEAAFAGHTAAIGGLAFSPDAAILASSSADGTVRLWDAATGKERAALPGEGSDLHAVEFSPDGSRIAFIGNRLDVWEVAPLRPVAKIGAPGAALAFAPGADSIRIVRDDGAGGEVKISSGQQIFARPEVPFRMGRVALTRDGAQVLWGPLMTGGGMAVTVEDFVTRKVQARQGIESAVNALAFSPDGRLAVCSVKGRLQLVLVSSGKPLSSVLTASETHSSLAFSPDSRWIATGDGSGEIVLHEVATGREILRRKGHAGAIGALRFAPDGWRLASGSRDTTALIWDLRPKVDAAPDPEEAWKNLAGDDARAAQRAIAALAAAPEPTLKMLESRLKPPPLETPAHVPALLRDLDGEDFATREKATEELRKLGQSAEAALQRALADAASSPEVRSRVKDLLDQLEPPLTASGEALRRIRAIQVLERIGSEGAREVLKRLGTADARAALARLSSRRGR